MPSLATGSWADWRSSSSSRHLAPAVGTAALLLLSLCPILLVDVPAMVDYPNHLARMSVLARAGTTAANPYYEVAWGLYPNLAMDLAVPPLARLIGVEQATRLFYLAGQLLVISGAMALAAAARGSFVVAAFVAALLLYSIPFAWGFVNFEVAVGVALWGIAAWIGLRGRHAALRLGLHAVFVASLFVAHLFGLGIYGAAIGLHELWRARGQRTPVTDIARTFLLMAAPVVALAFVAGLSGGAVGGERTEWHYGHKLAWLFLLNGYSREVSMALTAILALVGYGLFRSGRMRLAGAGPWIAAGFGLLFFAMPFRLRDTCFVDVRVLLAAALILPAFLRIEIPPGRLRQALATLLVLVTLANLAVAAALQLSYRSEYRTMIASFGMLTRGARVLVGHVGEAGDPPRNLLEYPIQHAPTLAVHYADALVPTLFTYPGKQPVVTREAERHLAPQQGGPIPLALLLAAADGTLPAGEATYFAGWPRDFDYLYLLGPKAPNPRPELLESLAEGSRFTLFRIRRPPGASEATRP